MTVYPGEIATRVIAGDLGGVVATASECQMRKSGNEAFPATASFSLTYAIQGTIGGLVPSLPGPANLRGRAPDGTGATGARVPSARPLGGAVARSEPAALRRLHSRVGGMDPGAQRAGRGAAARRGDARGPLPRHRLASARRRRRPAPRINRKTLPAKTFLSSRGGNPSAWTLAIDAGMKPGAVRAEQDLARSGPPRRLRQDVEPAHARSVR
jgi:hypothetical protein